MNKRTHSRLLAELEALFGRLAPGLEGKQIVSAGEDDLQVEVSIRVNRQAAPPALRDYGVAAAQLLRQHPLYVRHCQRSVDRRSSWGTRHREFCRGKVAAAVVYRRLRLSTPASTEAGYPTVHDRTGLSAEAGNDTAFRFVCARHRDEHGVDPEKVLAVVDILPSVLAEARKLADATEAERQKKWNEEQAARDREVRLVEEQAAQDARRRAVEEGIRSGKVAEIPAAGGPPAPTWHPSVGDELEVDDAPPGEVRNHWVRVRIEALYPQGFVARDSKGDSWSREFDDGRWRPLNVHSISERPGRERP